MKRSVYLCAVATLVFAITATAQMMQPMEKGEELKKLDFLVGEWTTADEMTFAPGAEPVKSSGITTFSWEVGDVWLRQYTEVTMGPMGKMIGTAHMTWDAEKEMYVSFWIDNFTARTYPSTGKIDENGSLVLIGTPEQMGTPFHSRYTWKKQDDGTVVFTMESSQDGENWMTGMKSILTRK